MVTARQRKSSIYHRPRRSLHDPLPGMSSSSIVPKYSIASNRKAPLIILEQHHSSFINNNTKTSSWSSTIFELSKLDKALPPAQHTSSSSLLASEPCSSRAISGESSSLPSSWMYPLSYCYDYEEDYHYGRSFSSVSSSTTAVEETEEKKEEVIRKYGGPSPPYAIGVVRTHQGMRRASLHFQDLQSLRNEKRCSSSSSL